MFILHIALQGCLRGSDVDYGITADTGGHIRYLLELVEASAKDEQVERIDIITRGFKDDRLGDIYLQAEERIDDKCRIIRLRSQTDAYLAKEELFFEHEALFAALSEYVESLDRRPDVIHAHYADAGRLGAALKDRFDIPMVFTAHSLGRVKQKVSSSSDLALTQRIDIETGVIASADLIIASSRDEAEGQYAEYATYAPGRIRIIPPGSDLAAFDAIATEGQVARRLSRFLNAPEKPCLLAIARPVTKKNLAGLVHAYGQCPQLQEKANLVIIAGSRGALAKMEPELKANMKELLALIDQYDLYGKVAYPKTHAQADIPQFYAYARETGGLFVNPALNEPFGLTLLEAAASGVPIVATDSGGPNDIVEACRNGRLVSPTDSGAISATCLDLLEDRSAWLQASKNGMNAVQSFDWTAHVRHYHELLQRLAATDRPAAAASCQIMLASDIDNTLVGCPDGVSSFGAWHARQRQLLFGIATGRSFHSALSILRQAGLELPRFVISDVGAEIHHLAANGVTYERDESWSAEIATDWQRARISHLLSSEAGLVPQAPLEQRAYKLSYFIEDDGPSVSTVMNLLNRGNVEVTVIRSHGRYLDILPARASKGAATEQVRRHFGIDRNSVIAAGDSGNDIELLRSVPKSIIVANYSDGLAEKPELGHAYVARNGYGRGVVEGVEYYLGKAA